MNKQKSLSSIALYMAGLLIMTVALRAEPITEPSMDSSVIVKEELNLKIINWNILYSFNHGKATQQGIGWIKKQSPDVLALQELNGNTAKTLKNMALKWGHNHSVILKENGFPVGLTSNQPIEVIEKRVKGFHHGYLHCKTQGIHFFVVHFWPSKPHEADIILKKAEALLRAGNSVIVLGDFNNRSLKDIAFDEKAKQPNACQITKKFEAADFVDTTHKHDKNAQFSFGSPILIPRWAKTMDDVIAKRQRIDFIFADKQLAEFSVSGTIMHSPQLDMISDHYPVVTHFRLGSRK